MVFLLYRHADDSVFDDFPKISDHLPKISEEISKLFRRQDERSRTFSKNFRKFPKISEDCGRLSRKTRRCFDDTPTNLKYNLRDKLDINEIIDKLTCEIMENKPLGSRMYFLFYFLTCSINLYMFEQLKALYTNGVSQTINNNCGQPVLHYSSFILPPYSLEWFSFVSKLPLFF